MPQLNSGGGDDLGATDEMIAFKDEGEQEEKIQANVFTEGDLADLKSSLVNESESSNNSNSSNQPSNVAAAGGTHAEVRGGLDPTTKDFLFLQPQGAKMFPSITIPMFPSTPDFLLFLRPPHRQSGACKILKEFIKRNSRITWKMVSVQNPFILPPFSLMLN